MAAQEPSHAEQSAGLPVWLGGLIRSELRGSHQLPERGIILLVRDGQMPLFRAVYGSRLSARQGFIHRPGSGAPAQEVSSRRLRGGQDVVIPVPTDAHQARLAFNEALRLARSVPCPVFPVGAIAGAHFPGSWPGGAAVPLPGTRAIVVLEAPFEVPPQPDQIPDTWLDALAHLLAQASGQAHDLLASWRRSGERPAG